MIDAFQIIAKCCNRLLELAEFSLPNATKLLSHLARRRRSDIKSSRSSISLVEYGLENDNASSLRSRTNNVTLSDTRVSAQQTKTNFNNKKSSSMSNMNDSSRNHKSNNSNYSSDSNSLSSIAEQWSMDLNNKNNKTHEKIAKNMSQMVFSKNITNIIKELKVRILSYKSYNHISHIIL